VTDWQSVDVRRALSPAGGALVVSLGAQLEAVVGAMEADMAAQVDGLPGDDGAAVRARFRAARTGWERFLWARLGVYGVTEGRAPDDALARAETDLLALSTLHGLY
jgi:hypothetical protein